ncbi:hypothetical protein THASP1DRAFT_28873, partial [Thamnocephalis sphaerospora]
MTGRAVLDRSEEEVVLAFLAERLDAIAFRVSAEGDAPLDNAAKLAVLTDVLRRDVSLFVQRYARHLPADMLCVFDRLREDDPELAFLLDQHATQSHSADGVEDEAEAPTTFGARNRRLAYLEQHLDATDYFSLEQIRLRAPGLWSAYVGSDGATGSAAGEKPFSRDVSLVDRLLYDVDLAKATNRETEAATPAAAAVVVEKDISYAAAMGADPTAEKYDAAGRYADNDASPIQHGDMAVAPIVESDEEFEEEFDTDDEEGQARAKAQRELMRRKRQMHKSIRMAQQQTATAGASEQQHQPGKSRLQAQNHLSVLPNEVITQVSTAAGISEGSQPDDMEKDSNEQGDVDELVELMRCRFLSGLD